MCGRISCIYSQALRQHSLRQPIDSQSTPIITVYILNALRTTTKESGETRSQHKDKFTWHSPIGAKRAACKIAHRPNAINSIVFRTFCHPYTRVSGRRERRGRGRGRRGGREGVETVY